MRNQKIQFNQILDAVVDKNKISKTFARTLLKELTALIQDGLLKDNTVSLAGFGIFRLHNMPQRTVRNIQNGQPIIIPAHRKVLFKPEKHVRELINKKYEELKAKMVATETLSALPKAEKKKDATETDITLSAIAASLDSMVREKPAKRELDELSDEPVLKDDILGIEQKETEKVEQTENRSNKKLYIGASLIAILLILLLFFQFGGDEPDEVKVAEIETPSIESTTKITEKQTATAKSEDNQAVKLKTIVAVKGDYLWHLAYKNYNDGYLWPLILQANKDKISNPDLIEPGESLKIPVVANPQKLNRAENKMLSEGHLTAYFAYKNIKQQDALNHLFVANKYDHENVKRFLVKIDQSDYQSIQNLSMK